MTFHTRENGPRQEKRGPLRETGRNGGIDDRLGRGDVGARKKFHSRPSRIIRL
jgi:hypothetical protein